MTAVIDQALLSSKFAHGFHTQNSFAGIASTQSLEKNKKHVAKQNNLSAVDTQSFRFVFTQSFTNDFRKQRNLRFEKA